MPEKRKLRQKWQMLSAAILLLGGLSFYANHQLQAQTEREQQFSIKANMHQLQSCLQAYADRHQGLYPENLQSLFKAAALAKPAPAENCASLRNPFSSQTGLNQAIADLKAYQPDPRFAGFVFYQPRYKQGKPVFYQIFGADQAGHLLTIYGHQKRMPTVKANMFTFQTMLESYAVDHQGLYPPNVDSLYQAASDPKAAYWKRARNPFQEPVSPEETSNLLVLTNIEAGQSDPDAPRWAQAKGQWVMDYTAYQPGKTIAQVLYEPLTEAGKLKNYRIYGTDQVGQLLQANAKVFVLSHH